jgi:hypothetical protein
MSTYLDSADGDGSKEQLSFISDARSLECLWREVDRRL